MTDVREAIRILQDGGIVAFPTETVWALACNAFDEESVEALRALKKRPEQVPLALGCHSWRSAQAWIVATPLADELAAAHMPGPISLVLPRRGDAMKHLAPDRDTLSIRVPDHEMATRILDAAGPLVMTSCNEHGDPDPILADEVRAIFPDLYIIGESVPGTASTVVDASGLQPVVLRQGTLTL